jgi:hypothetical protein
LLLDVEQVRDVATCGLEVAGVLGHGHVFVGEGEPSERTDRIRQPAFRGQLVHAGDGAAESCSLVLVHQPRHVGSNEGHRVDRDGLRPRSGEERQVGAGRPPTSPVGPEMLSI